jgi:hypothetical protein
MQTGGQHRVLDIEDGRVSFSRKGPLSYLAGGSLFSWRRNGRHIVMKRGPIKQRIRDFLAFIALADPNARCNINKRSFDGLTVVWQWGELSCQT